ncbi:ABC-2 type transporter [Colletotrichum truncatum]|uniref:ABC-2 type transporter n=1 Tax=Colletotrichum truncatum TaxID=5467 RepID=A0ACC3YDZ4_COLTU
MAGSSDEQQQYELEELSNLQRVATDLKRQTIIPNDPRLDPESKDFDHYRWAQAVLSTFNQEDITPLGQAVAFSGLGVNGSDAKVQVQHTVISSLLSPIHHITSLVSSNHHATAKTILSGFDGLLKGGELLLVLGRPGSGCTTFLKVITGLLNGLNLDPQSNIHYMGLSYEQMITQYRGEVAYNQELDEHFPHLTVAETLHFAAAARTPEQRPAGMTRSQYIDTVTKVSMAIFGLTHARDTKIGDNFVRGVSGGERKRVSIAEMFLSRARFGAWDNSTRGLDASSAIQFIRSLRNSADVGRACHAVAAYQASQPMYDLFDKVIVLYSGHQIFFGPTMRAVQYFEEMGWYKDPQQVAPDFLTAITNSTERRPRTGMEHKVPRTPEEFARYWQRSQDYQELNGQIQTFRDEHPFDAKDAETIFDVHQKQQANHTRQGSPYLLSIPMQIRLWLWRAFRRMRNDVQAVRSVVGSQVSLSLIIGSMFFKSPNNSSAFFQKGAVLFFSILMNAIITINEILQLYSQRPIVEKQARYAFVHPFTEAMRCSLLYGQSPPGTRAFFITAVFTMSAIFRSLASFTKSVGQAMGLAGIMVLLIVVYTGFTIPVTYMRPWFSWIRWINHIFYAFESLVSNEFHDRQFGCAAYIPPYGSGDSAICSSVGALPGQQFIQGDEYIAKNYNYHHSHLWRNYAILLSFMIVFHGSYFMATEFIRFGGSKAETLLYRPGHERKETALSDVENQRKDLGLRTELVTDEVYVPYLPKQQDILMWRGVNYDIPIKDGTRRLLDDVNGWVKPGTLTALMGVSGAGKTTLLDVLAKRVSIGVVNGDILVNGNALGSSFPRRTGYVQQQDLHLETTTVREALQFSAILRQPGSVSKLEKLEYVEEVIRMLSMEEFAETVVGNLGQGLNVEQRKLLSIGVELAAKPTLLVFLDEPTSGLDSQSSWTICSLLRKLADNGQAILATIHQPSALLFQTFDRLLFLAKGGRTVYFGDIGSQSRILLDYFFRNGAKECDVSENTAEYILRVVSDEKSNIDWPTKWKQSTEFQEVLAELEQLESLKNGEGNKATPETLESHFAMAFLSQLRYVTQRVFQQYFRQPEYIYAKFGLGIASGLFIGFSFWKVDSSQQGFQNALFSIFLLCSIFSVLVNQVMPKFVQQRSLYEVRERPSRIYSWQVFILSQVVVEIPWQAVVGLCAWASAFFPVFGGGISSENTGIVLLFIVQFYVYASSLAQMVIAAIESPVVGAMFATLMFGLSFLFNGVMQPPDALPRFWIFMYHLSPFTYYVAGISAAALANERLSAPQPS